MLPPRLRFTEAMFVTVCLVIDYAVFFHLIRHLRFVYAASRRVPSLRRLMMPRAAMPSMPQAFDACCKSHGFPRCSY